MTRWWKLNKFVLTTSGHFSQLALNFFLENKDVSGSFVVHAALCNRNCMCSTSCTKSFKKLNSLRIKLLRLEGETNTVHTTKQTSTTKSRHTGFLHFLIYYWSSELNEDFCQLLLCPDSTNSHLVIIYHEAIFVHLYTTVDALCNCIDHE